MSCHAGRWRARRTRRYLPGKTGSPCWSRALIVGGSAIGGGEWLAGPAVTARYGGALMWLATLSILCQVFYNMEISRYTLYTGEPIFTGKFRTLPGPRFWLFMYLLLDFGSVFPYLAANAATPLATLWLGPIPGEDDWLLMPLAGLRLLLGDDADDLRRQDLQHAQKGHDDQNRQRVRLSAAGRHFLFDRDTWIDISSGFFRLRHRPGPAGRRPERQRHSRSGEDWDRDDGNLDVG